MTSYNVAATDITTTIREGMEGRDERRERGCVRGYNVAATTTTTTIVVPNILNSGDSI